MKVVLVALYDIRSYGIRILHALLEQNGYDVVSIFLNEDMECGHYSQEELDLLVQLIKNENPGLIGIAVRSPLFILFKKLTAKIKKHIDSPIIAGGHHPTIAPDECIQHADIVCVGEGEQPTLEVCEKLSNGKPINDIENLWVKTDHTIYKNSMRPLIDNLDKIPFPDYSNKNKIYIQKGKIINNGINHSLRRQMSVITTRGCFFNCSFCYNATLKNLCKGKGNYVRRRSVNNVIEEIKLLKQQFNKLEYIFFSDNVFTYNKKWINDFCKTYPVEVNLPFGCFSHFSMLDEEILTKLKDTGLRDITLGIQSGSSFISNAIYNRHIKKSDIIKNSQLIAKLGIKTNYDLITNNPYETDQTHKETLELLLKLKQPYTLRTFKMKYFPRVPLTNRLIRDGVISEQEIESNKESSFNKWTDPLDLQKGKNTLELFWDSVYFMVQARFPKFLIKNLSESVFLRKNPILLASILKYGVHSAILFLSQIKSLFRFALKGDFYLIWNELFKKIKNHKGWGY